MAKSDNVQETSAVRLLINVDKLQEYLASEIPEFQAPLEVRQFNYGQSNPTYLLIDASKKRYVLRKKPSGTLLSTTAHAVEREFRILDALSRNTDIPVPQVYLLCENKSIIGTPFYVRNMKTIFVLCNAFINHTKSTKRKKVMEFLKGRIFKDASFSSLSPNDCKQCWYSAIDTLAKLHSVDYKSIGLEGYGKPSGFYSRQIRSLLKVTAVQAAVRDENGVAVGEIPRLDEIIKWLKRNELPDETTIVHGDYKIDNLVYHPTESRVIGILDWELSTIGHPMSDVANLLMHYYVRQGAFEFIPGFIGAKDINVPSLEDLMQRYCEKTKRPYPIKKYDFAVVFSFFRFCVISQGIDARVALKQSSSAEAKKFSGIFKKSAAWALEIIDRGDLVTQSRL
ncbi:12787_t:CDS:2 [Ambispora leptoticha]|uniref:12787_t:CDS:1 n=1 Tax=Ambispora leptoticha TaxID=144679 RepID=A0A9N8VK42_9GLOM|nr:12787_t:CDS:2 [Ambispora leptoticha]